jgi:hypothetical protein
MRPIDKKGTGQIASPGASFLRFLLRSAFSLLSSPLLSSVGSACGDRLYPSSALGAVWLFAQKVVNVTGSVFNFTAPSGSAFSAIPRESPYVILAHLTL